MHGNTYDIDDLIAGEIKSFNSDAVKEEDKYVKNLNATNNIKANNLRKVYLTALAREKYDLYRTNHYFVISEE